MRSSDAGTERAVPLSMTDLTRRAILLASSPTRSRLAVVLEMAIRRRRSRAVGWRRAMMEDSSRSISISIAFTRASVSITRCAVSPSKCSSAWMASRICDSAMPPSSITREETVLSSLSNWVERCLSGISSLLAVSRSGR